nr:hypothetical protein CFP56_24596 [Quercus suber]
MLSNRPRGVHPRTRPSLAEIIQEREAANDHTPFGNKVEIDYGRATTMQQCGTIELQFIERLLRTVLPSDLSRTSQQMMASADPFGGRGFPVLLTRKVEM